jgi:hypothetical protein
MKAVLQASLFCATMAGYINFETHVDHSWTFCFYLVICCYSLILNNYISVEVH